MSDPDGQPRHVGVLSMVASTVWVLFFLTIAIGAHWGRDSVVLLILTIVATAVALVAHARSLHR